MGHLARQEQTPYRKAVGIDVSDLPNATANTIAELIRNDGPITVADYMAIAGEAYYQKENVFGAKGDFVTAPEISQVFGELIGLWCVTAWQQLGEPRLFNLVECGPGRGTLMKDAMRTVSEIAPRFAHSADIHFLERSPARRAEQEKAIADHDVSWHGSLGTLPDGPCIFVANEFLDALPIRQFIKTEAGWCERIVALDGQEFAFSQSPEPTMVADGAFDDAAPGSLLEVSDAVTSFVADLAERCVRAPGIALIIDYGYSQSATGETLQAVKDHEFHSVLDDAGEADLTAHVDFATVAQTARGQGAAIFGPAEQGLWLRRIGATVREAQLCADKSADQADAIRAGVRRLIDPEHMGTLFKVLSIAPPSVLSLAGFEADL